MQLTCVIFQEKDKTNSYKYIYNFKIKVGSVISGNKLAYGKQKIMQVQQSANEHITRILG